MPWVRFDDGYLTNRKVLKAGRDGRDLHMACVFHSARELTDGEIDAEAMAFIGGTAGIMDVQAAIDRCVAAVGASGEGLLVPTATGYRIHDYHDYNPTRAQVEHNRIVRAEAGSRGGQAKASKLLNNSKQIDKQNPSKTVAKLYPVPDPVNVNSIATSSQEVTVFTAATVNGDAPHQLALISSNGNGHHDEVLPAPWPDRAWCEQAFDECFWPHFKRKTGKQRGRDAYIRLLMKCRTFDQAYALAQQIMEMVIEQFAHWTDLTKSPAAESYINGRRWEDEQIIPTGGGVAARSRGRG